MKKSTIVLIAILLSVSIVSAQDWTQVEFPPTETITGIYFIHPDTGYIVTYSGKFGCSFDGGKTWQLSAVDPGKPLEDLHFTGNGKGLICAREGALYITKNGGKSWIKSIIGGATSALLDIEMLDDDTGLIVGISPTNANRLTGEALRTVDGGKSWTSIENPGFGCAEILYIPDGMLYYLSFGMLNYSDDKGATWQKRRTHDGTPARTIAMYGRTAIIGGSEGMVRYSHDGGLNWTPADQGQQKVFVASVLISETEGYMAGIMTPVIKTTDGGISWKEETTPFDFNVFDMFLIGDVLWAAGDDGGLIYKKVR